MIRLDEDPKKPKGLHHDEELMWIIYEMAQASGYQRVLSLEEAASIQPTVWRDLFYLRAEVNRQLHYIQGDHEAESPLPDDKPKDPRQRRVRHQSRR